MNKLFTLIAVVASATIATVIAKTICAMNDCNLWKGWDGDLTIKTSDKEDCNTITVDYDVYRDIITLGKANYNDAMDLMRREFTFDRHADVEFAYKQIVNEFSKRAVKRETYENEDFSVYVDGAVLQHALYLALTAGRYTSDKMVESQTGYSCQMTTDLVDMFIYDNIDADDDCRIIKPQVEKDFFEEDN